MKFSNVISQKFNVLVVNETSCNHTMFVKHDICPIRTTIKIKIINNKKFKKILSLFLLEARTKMKSAEKKIKTLLCIFQ